MTKEQEYAQGVDLRTLLTRIEQEYGPDEVERRVRILLERAYLDGRETKNVELEDQYAQMIAQGIALKQAEQDMRRKYVHVQNELRTLLGSMS